MLRNHIWFFSVAGSVKALDLKGVICHRLWCSFFSRGELCTSMVLLPNADSAKFIQSICQLKFPAEISFPVPKMSSESRSAVASTVSYLRLQLSRRLELIIKTHIYTLHLQNCINKHTPAGLWQWLMLYRDRPPATLKWQIHFAEKNSQISQALVTASPPTASHLIGYYHHIPEQCSTWTL